jgi:opacity protein-like surface antigen
MVCVLLLLVAVVASGQEMRTNNQGVLFSFSGLADLGLGSYQSGAGMVGIGAKLFNAAGDKAIRPMVVFNTGSQKSVPDAEDYVGEKQSHTSFGILVDGIKHMNKAAITPYIGVGVGYGKSSEKTESGHSEGDDPNVTENSTSGFSVRAILGVEVFIKKNISLSGEYRLAYGSSTATTKLTQAGADESSESKVEQSSLGIGASGLLTLAIYLR